MPDGAFVFIGAGALGRTFATVLAAAGHPVVLVAREPAAAQLRALPVLRVRGAVESSAPVRGAPPAPGAVTAATLGDELPRGAAVLFTTKAHQLGAAASAVALTWPAADDPDAWTAGLQNGLLAGDQLGEVFGPGRVVGACTVLGARRVAGGAAVASLGMTYLGELGGGRGGRAEAAARALRGAGLPGTAADDIREVLWAKMCNAVGVFGVSALTGMPTSQIMGSPPLVRAYRALLEEAALVARAEGVTVADYPDLPMRTYLDLAREEMVKRLTGRPAQDGAALSFSSMAQDLAGGRPTEYEQVFGDLLRRAGRLGVPVPRAALVYDLIAGLDAATQARAPG